MTPRTTLDDKTEKVGITLPIHLVKQTDKARGNIPRSTFILRALEQYIRGKGDRCPPLRDLIPLAGTIGGGFFDGLLAGYVIKKVIKIVAVIVGLFIAALAYLEYQRIIQVDWTSIQALSQSGITWLANVVTHFSNNMGADHTGATANLAISSLIPLASSTSAGLMFGLARS